MNFPSITSKTIKRSNQMAGRFNEYSNSQPLPSSAENINQCHTLNANQIPNSSLVAFLPDSSEVTFKNNYSNSLRFSSNPQQNCNLPNIVSLNSSNFSTRPMTQSNVLSFVQQQQPQPVQQSLVYNVPNNYRQLTKGSLANLTGNNNSKMGNSIEMPNGFNYPNHLEFAAEYQRQIPNQSHHHPWCGKVDYLRKHNLNAFLAQSIRYSTPQLSANNVNTNYDLNRSNCYPIGNYSPRFPAAIIQARNKILSAGYENAFHEIQNLINPYLIVHQRLMSEQFKYNNNIQPQQNANVPPPSYIVTDNNGKNNSQVSALNEMSSLNPHASSFFPIQQLDSTKAMFNCNNRKCLDNSNSGSNLSSQDNIQLKQQQTESIVKESPEKARCAPISVCEEFLPSEINFNKFVSMLVDDINDTKEKDFDSDHEELFDLTSKSAYYDDYDKKNANQNDDSQFEDSEIYVLNEQQLFRQRDRGGSFNSSTIIGQPSKIGNKFYF